MILLYEILRGRICLWRVFHVKMPEIKKFWIKRRFRLGGRNDIVMRTFSSRRTLGASRSRCVLWMHSWRIPRAVQKKRDSAFAKSLFLRVPGLEPGAFWFVAKRSIQLGYIRVLFCFVVFSRRRAQI